MINDNIFGILNGYRYLYLNVLSFIYLYIKIIKKSFNIYKINMKKNARVSRV